MSLLLTLHALANAGYCAYRDTHFSIKGVHVGGRQIPLIQDMDLESS